MRLVALCMSLLIRRALSMARAAGPRQLRIEQALAATFSPTVLEVLNESHGRHEDESHFKGIVVSDQFEGVKPLIKRHRMVTAAITKDTGGPPRRPPPRSRARGRARRRARRPSPIAFSRRRARLPLALRRRREDARGVGQGRRRRRVAQVRRRRRPAEAAVMDPCS